MTRLGNRVGNGQKSNFKITQNNLFAKRRFLQISRHLGLFQLFRARQALRRTKNRQIRKIGQNIGKSANMIFMAMGEKILSLYSFFLR